MTEDTVSSETNNPSQNLGSATDATRDKPITEGIVESGTKPTGNVNELSPVDEVKKRAYEAQVSKEQTAKFFWNVMIFTVPAFLTILGILVTIYLGLFTYYLTNISGPVSSIQTEITNLKEEDDSFQDDIRELRSEKSKVVNEEFISQ